MPHPLPNPAEYPRSRAECIVEGIDAVLWEARWPGFELTYISAGAERLLGYPASLWDRAPELLSMVVHCDDFLLLRTTCDEAVRSGHNQRAHVRMIAAGGREVRVLAMVHGAGADADERSIRGLFIDETAAFAAEDSATLADRRWRTLLARSADLAMILNRQGQLVEATPSFANFGGVERVEDFSGPLLDMVHPDDRLQVIDAFWRVSRQPDGSAVRVDYRTAVASGGYVWVEAIYTTHLTDPAINGVVVNIRDITARRAGEDALRAAAYTDSLTGLPNRSGLQAALADETLPCALFLLDIDGFKEINDTLGHEIGDRVLREVAGRLTSAVRPGDLVARLAGDEFAVVTTGCDTLEDLDRVATVLLASFDDAVVIEEVKLRVGAKMGGVLGDGDDTPGRLLRRADVALERARQNKVDWVRWVEGDDLSASRLGLLSDLHHAVHGGLISVVFQPKLDLLTGQVVGVETLARWDHPERGPVSPAEFIPMTEQSGLIRPLTAHVLRLALDTLAAWRRDGLELSVAVNVSPTTLRDPELLDTVARALAKAGVPASLLVLELTESALAGSDDATMATLMGLHDLGVRLSIDDFGTGYSVLSYLKRLPITELKIDREFVTHAGTDPRDLAIAASVVELAHRLGMSVVAEGVEDLDTAALMAEIGCDLGQGFGLCRPIAAHDVPGWVTAASPLPVR